MWFESRQMATRMAGATAALTLFLGACAPAAQPSPTAAPAKPTSAPTAAPAAKPTEAPKPAAPAATTAPAPAAKPTEAAKPAAPAPTTAPAAKPAAVDLNALYEAAKREGQVTIYTTLNTQWGKPLTEKFMARYPGVKVNYNRQSSEKLAELMRAEASAGKMPWDVVEGNQDEFTAFLDLGFMQAYAPAAADKFPANLKDPKGMWVTDRVNPTGISVNTERIKDLPKNWDDLLDPRFKGQLVAEEGNILVFSAMKDHWGEERALRFWRGIAANGAQVRSGNTLVAELLAAGEFGASVATYLNAPQNLADQGAPIKVIQTDPVFLQLQMVGMGAKAPSPNAAKLYIEWLLGDEGQATLDAVGVTPARPDAYRTATEKWLGNAPTVPIKAELTKNTEKDRAQYREILGLR